MMVQIPAGTAPNAVLQVRAPDGRTIKVRVPRNMRPGQQMRIAVPAAAPKAPTYFAVGARVKCKDGTVGSISKVCHDDPDGVYYQVDCGGVESLTPRRKT